jgi:cytochrome c-type biogenesis protein CcmE
MTTGRKLLIGGLIIAAVTAYMAYRGASASWQYYVTVDECAAEGASLAGRPLRVSGRVAAGTLAIDRDRRQASFTLEGNGTHLSAVCRGPMPDNLAEGIAVLVEGRIDKTGLLQGDKVLTRCDGKREARP